MVASAPATAPTAISQPATFSLAPMTPAPRSIGATSARYSQYKTATVPMSAPHRGKLHALQGRLSSTGAMQRLARQRSRHGPPRRGCRSIRRSGGRGAKARAPSPSRRWPAAACTGIPSRERPCARCAPSPGGVVVHDVVGAQQHVARAAGIGRRAAGIPAGRPARPATVCTQPPVSAAGGAATICAGVNTPWPMKSATNRVAGRWYSA